jgi:uncharacterized protein (UPF0210 family)
LVNEKDFVLDFMRTYGKNRAEALQAEAPEMTNDALNEQQQHAPDFRAACEAKNMLQRSPGFVCVSSAGRVVRLLQVYDSSVFTSEPEDLPAQWGFVWSTDPAYAKPFIALSTSPYGKGECCTEEVNGTTHVYRSKIDNNVWAPSAAPTMWEQVD